MKTEDQEAAKNAIRSLLTYLGEDPHREGLLKTPDRVARSLRELTDGYRQDPEQILSTTFAEACDEMVVVREIPFWSLCEHHLLPFHGTATVGYLPRGRIVGLSKIGRLVHCFARRLQVQEKMTQQIAQSIMDHLSPHGVGVVLKAQHQCMAMRGVRAPAEMLTSCLLGQFKEASTRAEFLSYR
jgi:GTP cyclohydrolase I